MSARSGARERSAQCGASECVSGGSEHSLHKQTDKRMYSTRGFHSPSTHCAMTSLWDQESDESHANGELNEARKKSQNFLEKERK